MKFTYSVPATERGDLHEALVDGARSAGVDDDLAHAVSRSVQEAGEKLGGSTRLVAVEVDGTTGEGDVDTLTIKLTATPRA